MKYVHMSIMLLSFAALLIFGYLAMAWQFLGAGLHPALAALGMVTVATFGYHAAVLLDTLETA